MKISKAYPYPVLRKLQDDFADEDIYSTGTVSGQVQEDNLYTHFHFEAKLDDEAILNYIEQGLAEYTCEIDAPDTFFRMCENHKDPVFEIQVPRSTIAGRVNIQICVVAKFSKENGIATITNYKNEKLNHDYDGLDIEYYPGDIMAILGDIDFYADIDYRKAKNISSFMCIMEDENTDIVDFTLDADKIIIKMPQKMFKQYQEDLKGDKKFAAMLEASLVANALIHAFHFIQDYEYKLWARSLNALLQNDEDLLKLNVDPVETPEYIPLLVQTLLKKPFERMFCSIDNIQTLLS